MDWLNVTAKKTMQAYSKLTKWWLHKFGDTEWSTDATHVLVHIST